jgi:endonuclease-3
MTITSYGKKFNFDSFMSIMKDTVKNYKVPIITLIAVQEKDPFKVLITTMLSARTKDDITAAASNRLFSVAPTPQKLAKLSVNEIEKLIYPVGFYKTKAPRIKETSQMVLDYGEVPDTIEELLKLPGVGRKTANLILGEAFKKDAICVDVHVHIIANRLGWVKTKSPKQSELDLMKILPKIFWIKINTYLVAFGQAICTTAYPKCGRCPIIMYCKYKKKDVSRI